MSCERDNSLLGRLYSKGRQSLLAETLEMLVLGHQMLLDELRADSKIKAQAASGVDWEQIIEEFEARMQGILSEISDAEESDSDQD
jgi:hypothetical protein